MQDELKISTQAQGKLFTPLREANFIPSFSNIQLLTCLSAYLFSSMLALWRIS